VYLHAVVVEMYLDSEMVSLVTFTGHRTDCCNPTEDNGNSNVRGRKETGRENVKEINRSEPSGNYTYHQV
jgi:hypothetical protein